MERLQIAIEKARANREKARGDAPLTNPEAVPETAAVSPAEAGPKAPPLDAGDSEANGSGKQPDVAPPPEAPASDPWRDLPGMALKLKPIRRRRVATLEPGPDALPFDQLRTRIVQQCRQQGWRRLAVVSSHSAAGKTTLIANLAFCLGRQSDLKTIVIDFDLRRPGLGKLLGQSPRHSMADVINGSLPFAAHALRFGDNLAFGLNNRAAKNSAELLQSAATAEFLSGLEATYRPDLMLFDMPPVLAADDALGFLRLVDAALIVIEAERTPISQIEVLEAQVAELTTVMGIVLNRCNYTSQRRDDYGYY